jgi:hypothetical protein
VCESEDENGTGNGRDEQLWTHIIIPDDLDDLAGIRLLVAGGGDAADDNLGRGSGDFVSRYKRFLWLHSLGETKYSGWTHMFLADGCKYRRRSRRVVRVELDIKELWRSAIGPVRDAYVDRRSR